MKYLITVFLLYSQLGQAALIGLPEFESSKFNAGVVSNELKSGYRNYQDSGQVYQACVQLASSFTEDIAKMNESYEEFRNLVDQGDYLNNSQKIHELKMQIDQYTERIVKASNPDWNTEKILVGYNWNIEPKFLQVYKDDKIYIEKVSLKKSYFLGKENNQLQKSIFVEPEFEGEEKYGPKISYYKAATILELCQFMRTLKLVVNVEYYYYFLNYRINANQDLTLEIH